jgi:signal transduction histidine kinase
MTDPSSAQPLECPNCGAAVSGGTAECPECGVDIFLLTDLLYRQRLEEALASSPATPTSTEELVPRLGEALVAQHIISKDQLQRALEIQREETRQGVSRRLGQILVENGILPADALDRAITSQVLNLQQALQQANRKLEERVRERTHELTRALEKLSEINQLKANFVANISHELRTPMTHIIGYVDLLEDGTFGQLMPQQTEAVASIHRASQRLHDLIEDLIQYSDTSRGEITLNIQTVGLRDCIQESYSRVTAKAQRGNVRVDVVLPPELPAVRADARRITWVITQLLDNGVKFTPSGGKVELRARQDGIHVSVAVTDSGIGIPSARLSELFQPFQQLDGGLTRRFGGTGIGLSMCKMIVDAHGSSLAVQSTEGQGSVFQFQLPVARVSDSSPAGTERKNLEARL